MFGMLSVRVSPWVTNKHINSQRDKIDGSGLNLAREGQFSPRLGWALMSLLPFDGAPLMEVSLEVIWEGCFGVSMTLCGTNDGYEESLGKSQLVHLAEIVG